MRAVGFHSYIDPTVWRSRSRNRHSRQRRNATDGRRAGWKRRSGDKGAVTLPGRRTIRICGRVASRTSACKGVDVGIWCCVTVREGLQEGYDLVLFLVGQHQVTDCHILVVVYLWHRPAVDFLGGSRRAVSGSDVVHISRFVAGIVEVHELLQALDVAVVEELLLEVRPRSLGGRTLWRCHGDVGRAGRWHLAIRSWPKLCPMVIRACQGAETASEEGS